MCRVTTLGLSLLLGLLVPAALRAQTKDDTVVYALQSDVNTWDPPNSVLREAFILSYNVFDHLAARDVKTGKVGPSLALSWKALNDTIWEVKLRKGVKFHDGSPFTARDVKATFDRVLNPENKLVARGNHAKIKSVEIVDESTVHFLTDGPYPVFVERLTALVMQSEKIIKEKGHEWMQENPVGTGPYKLVKWTRKQEHLLVRNDDYWGPKPSYKYVRVRIIPETATQIAELISGGVGRDQGRPARSDGCDQQVGPGAHRDRANSPDGHAPARPGGPRRAQPLHRPARSPGGQPRHRCRRRDQARAQRPRRPGRDGRQPDGLRF
jgi:peptide/nickel transport system substrate-binding protein